MYHTPQRGARESQKVSSECQKPSRIHTTNASPAHNMAGLLTLKPKEAAKPALKGMRTIKEKLPMAVVVGILKGKAGCSRRDGYLFFLSGALSARRSGPGGRSRSVGRRLSLEVPFFFLGNRGSMGNASRPWVFHAPRIGLSTIRLGRKKEIFCQNGSKLQATGTKPARSRQTGRQTRGPSCNTQPQH
jgi:hypothetical protein